MVGHDELQDLVGVLGRVPGELRQKLEATGGNEETVSTSTQGFLKIIRPRHLSLVCDVLHLFSSFHLMLRELRDEANVGGGGNRQRFHSSSIMFNLHQVSWQYWSPPLANVTYGAGLATYPSLAATFLLMAEFSRSRVLTMLKKPISS